MLLWHGLAKLRMHTKYTLDMLRTQTTLLGQELRRFQSEICPHYKTEETPREQAARIRAHARRQAQKNANTQVESNALVPGASVLDASPGTRKEKTFNLSTYKLHSLGDYPLEITGYGTTDGFSTQLVSHPSCSIVAVMFTYLRASMNIEGRKLATE